MKQKINQRMDLRNEILKALPIPVFHVWADELLEMEKEGVVKIERGRVELVE